MKPSRCALLEMAAATQELKNSIQVKLEQTGEYDKCVPRGAHRERARSPREEARLPLTGGVGGHARRLKEHLRQKLIDSGWRDNLKEYTMGARPFFRARRRRSKKVRAWE